MKIQLEVTTRCNSNCVYCPRADSLRAGARTLGDIEAEVASTVIQELKKLDKVQVSISGLGEPLLYSGLIDLIHQIRQACRKVVIGVNTNGILLKGSLADQLINSVDRLVCGLNLPTEQTHKTFTGIDKFSLIVDNIVEFLHKKGNHSPSTKIRLFDFNETHQFIPEATRFWRQHLNRNDLCVSRPVENWAGLISLNGTPELLPKSRVCQFFSRHLTITKEGNTSFCCYSIAFEPNHPFILGNIRNHSIREFLNCEKLREMRLQHAKGLLEQCERCCVVHPEFLWGRN